MRELHINTSKLVSEAAEGGVIVIERRGMQKNYWHALAAVTIAEMGAVGLVGAVHTFGG